MQRLVDQRVARRDGGIDGDVPAIGFAVDPGVLILDKRLGNTAAADFREHAH
jgi:hypothetical protein